MEFSLCFVNKKNYSASYVSSVGSVFLGKIRVRKCNKSQLLEGCHAKIESEDKLCTECLRSSIVGPSRPFVSNLLPQRRLDSFRIQMLYMSGVLPCVNSVVGPGSGYCEPAQESSISVSEDSLKIRTVFGLCIYGPTYLLLVCSYFLNVFGCLNYIQSYSSCVTKCIYTNISYTYSVTDALGMSFEFFRKKLQVKNFQKNGFVVGLFTILA